MDPSGTALANNDDEGGNCATPFTKADGTPCTLRPDAILVRNIAPDGTPPRWLRGEIAVFRIPTAAEATTGARYFYVESRAQSAAIGKAPARVVTAAVVRHVSGLPTPLLANGEIDWRERP
jgi:hypothetical protein